MERQNSQPVEEQPRFNEVGFLARLGLRSALTRKAVERRNQTWREGGELLDRIRGTDANNEPIDTRQGGNDD